MSRAVMAWHWVVKGEDGKLKLRDGREVPAVGVPLVHEGEVEMCESGLHASRRAIDALAYIPNGATVLCRVKCQNIVDEQDDKLVCRKRTVVWSHDCEKLLHEFACRCAERALTNANVTDERSWNAIKVKRAWLKGEATDKELAAAWEAAREAAREAAWAAASAAAWAAARDAARDAAWEAAKAAQESELLEMLRLEGWDGE